MIKKKVNEDLRSKNITFQIENVHYQAIRFYQTKMTVDVIIIEGDDKNGILNIPFAHIPKATKKILKPT